MKHGGVSQIDEAVKTLQKRPGPISEAATSLYTKLARKVLSRNASEENSSDQPAVVAALRDVMFRVAKQYRSQSSDKQLPAAIEELLMAAHYQHMYYTSFDTGLVEIAAKCAITLLKYPNVIAHDKAFYQAGNICREINNINLAFMLLNR